jgi:hypothetical protein
VTVEVGDALPQILGDRVGRFEVGIVQCGFSSTRNQGSIRLSHEAFVGVQKISTLAGLVVHRLRDSPIQKEVPAK